jgi:hypothetical protein
MPSTKTKKAQRTQLTEVPVNTMQLVAMPNGTGQADLNVPLGPLVLEIDRLVSAKHSDEFRTFVNRYKSGVYHKQLYMQTEHGAVQVTFNIFKSKDTLRDFLLKNATELFCGADESTHDFIINDRNFTELCGKYWSKDYLNVKASGKAAEVMGKTVNEVDKMLTVVAKAEIAQTSVGKLKALLLTNAAVIQDAANKAEAKKLKAEAKHLLNA